MKLIVCRYSSPKGMRMYSWIRNVTSVASVMTKTTAPDIPTAVEILLDTPKKGQMPKNWENTMLLTNIAPIMIMNISMILKFYAFFLIALMNATINPSARNAPGASTKTRMPSPWTSLWPNTA